MKSFWLALRELYIFATESFRHQETAKTKSKLIEPIPFAQPQSSDAVKVLLNTVVSKDVDAETNTSPVLLDSRTLHGHSGVYHYISVSEISLYQRPTKEFDRLVTKIPYSAAVRVIGSDRSWSEIEYKNYTGWVSSYALTQDLDVCMPSFTGGVYYENDHSETRKVRLVIQDCFNGAEAELPLHGEEYIYYRLLAQNIYPPHISHQPKTAGVWHKIFSGQLGVYISITPKKGSIMECTYEDGTSILMYVESVSPDGVIMCSGVGKPEDGYFFTATFRKEEWIELRPVFIQFS